MKQSALISGHQSKSESGKTQSRGFGGNAPQEIFETAHSEMLSGGSFGLEYSVKGASKLASWPDNYVFNDKTGQ